MVSIDFNPDSKPKVGVVGTSGFIGSRLISKLQIGNTVPIRTDRSSSESLRIALESSGLSHLVLAVGRASSPRRYFDSDELSTLVDSLWTARHALAELKGLIWFGSGAEYGGSERSLMPSSTRMPANEYGLAKSLESRILESLSTQGVPVQIIRPSTLFGEHQTGPMLVPSIFRAITEGIPLEVLSPNAVKDFIHVDDLVDLVRKQVQLPNFATGAFICARGQSMLVREFVSLLLKDASLEQKNLISFSEKTPSFQEVEIFDISKTTEVTGWKPTDNFHAQIGSTFSSEGLAS